MAELVVKSRSISSLRQMTDVCLNTTFPLWGVVSPFAVFGLTLAAIASMQQGTAKLTYEYLAYLAVCLCFSVGCLLLKRALACDYMIVDRDGLKLPRLLGTNIHVRSYIPWNQVESITAFIETASNDINKCRLIIKKKRGRAVQLSTKLFEADFLEQFLLAAKMWAPEVCNQTLDEYQNVLRIGTRGTNAASYTELWEDELGRRFCPTSYIPLEAGRVLNNNHLKVMSHLASGGLSAIYLCQLDGKKLVALKEATIPDGTAEGLKEKAVELFQREASLLIKLNHPGIVQVLDCFSEGGRNYMLMEHVNGVDLRQLVKQNGPQKEAAVLEWAIQIATALKYMHEREPPIIHRDLTPDNIVLRNDGQVVIVDFGAANEFIGTATGTFVGKHAFISPEQFRGKATIQSDIYAFGCTLHFLLTGQEPEALSTSNPRSQNTRVCDELAELVESCTQLETKDRYQSVAQMIPVLRRLASQSVVL